MKETTERLHILLQDFCAANGGGRFELNDEGVCSLIMDDSAILNIAAQETTKEALIFAPLGTIPEDVRDNTLTEMLAYNFFPEEPAAFSFALQGKDQVILTARYPVQSLSLTIFQDVLDRFIKQMKTWQERLNTPPLDDAAAAQQSETLKSEASREPERPPMMQSHMSFMIKG